ncbi:MAG: alanine/ornithine racemase family PLP-dependent enzyme [Planctomycetota bacterium]|jgi:predicted amino acid racemase
MSAPRLEIELDKIQHNARFLVQRLSKVGVSVTGVTKATLGSPEIARVLLEAGVQGLGDSRIENIEGMRRESVGASMTLLRSPLMSQGHRVVASADVSFNTEIDVIRMLSVAAKRIGKPHGVVLMVELGDLREGLLPGDLASTVRQALRLPNITLDGIGTNLACQNGVVPDARNMAELSTLADSVEAEFGIQLGVVSGGNSANLTWSLSGANLGRINDLRLGESVLLGRETLAREPIPGLHTDAMTLVGEVIESKPKPSQPWGEFAQTAFGEGTPRADRGEVSHAILALGRQDIDPDGLLPPKGIEILGASSDHLVVDCGTLRLPVGSEVRFQLDYSALLRAMTSPFVAKVMRTNAASPFQ